MEEKEVSPFGLTNNLFLKATVYINRACDSSELLRHAVNESWLTIHSE